MKRHRTDGVSLTFGVIFLAIAAWWLFAQTFHLALPTVGWIAASALILVGLFGLVGALRSDQSDSGQSDSGKSDSDPVSGAPADTAPPATVAAADASADDGTADAPAGPNSPPQPAKNGTDDQESLQTGQEAPS